MEIDRADAGLVWRPAGWALFFALYPPPDAVRRIAALAEAEGLTGPRVAPERLHISLLGLGRHEALPSAAVNAIRTAAATVKVAPFVLSLNHLTSFASARGVHPRVLVGDDGVIGVCALREALHGALARARLARGPAGAFEPHVTLSRERGLMPDAGLLAGPGLPAGRQRPACEPA